MHAQRERPERNSVQAWNKAMKDVFARCSKKMAVQVCTVIIVCSFSCNVVCFHNMLDSLYLGKLIHNSDWCLFFRRLKINHDSHEFTLESGTIANRNMQEKEGTREKGRERKEKKGDELKKELEGTGRNKKEEEGNRNIRGIERKKENEEK
jgi:hypothetical protein